MVIGNSKEVDGGGVVLKAKNFKGKYEANPEFLEGWVQTQKPSVGGMDIF